MGLVAGLLGCLFGVLGILVPIVGAAFVILAAICTVVGLLASIARGSGGGAFASIMAGVLTAIGFATSPSLWIGTALIATKFGVKPPALDQQAHSQPKPQHAGTIQSPDGMVVWSAKDDGDPRTYSINEITLTLLSRKTAPDGVVPVLHVKAATGEEYEAAGQGQPTYATATFGVGKLDPGGRGDQVLFETYGFGAHCCTELRILDLVGGAWKDLNVGSFDGGDIAFPKDIDGDGVPDIVVTDDRFAYQFAPYADSVLPSRIFNIVDGEVVDVSAGKRYADLYRAQMEEAQKGCLAHNNGACAAFVADAARRGRFDWAWSVMMKDYNASSDWLLPTGCRIATAGEECPKDQELTFHDFPTALRWFLEDAGYVTRDGMAPDSASAAQTERMDAPSRPAYTKSENDALQRLLNPRQ